MSTIKSRKAKGRRLQDWTRSTILKALAPELSEENISTAIMGEGGADVKLESHKQELFPYSVECKNCEKLNVWTAYDQAKTHDTLEPLLIMKKNLRTPLAVIDADYFIKLVAALSKLEAIVGIRDFHRESKDE